MNIAIVFSPNWTRYALIETFAIFNTNPAPIKVYLISDGEPQFDTNELFLNQPGYKIEYLNLEKLYQEKITSSINVTDRFTKYVLYRLLLPLVIKDNRLLYIDADAIVNGDLTDFYNIDMVSGGTYSVLLAGVADCGEEQYHLRKNIGLHSDDSYLNAGVTLMNLGEIRREGLTEKWIEAANTKRYFCQDQDILNLTCRGRIKEVHPRFNVSVSTSLDVPSDSIRICHYAGPPKMKPWAHDGTSHVPFQEIWDHWEKKYDDRVQKKYDDRVQKRVLINTQSQIPTLPQTRIPKKIHYCWFGGKPKPPLVQRCLASWKEHLSDYEIIEWNESKEEFNLDCCPFVRDAYKSGKFAFVTDYLRMWALYKFGGIYMDVDVEVLKSFDRFLDHRAFTGHEIPELWVTAVMGAEPGHPWIKMLLDYYHNTPFTGVSNTQVITNLSRSWLEKEVYGFKYLREGVVIYPTDTFCGYDHPKLLPIVTENSYANHLFAGTWLGRTVI